MPLWSFPFDRSGCEVGRHILGESPSGFPVLIEARDGESGLQLASDLIRQGVTELQAVSLGHDAFQFSWGQTAQIGIRKGVPKLVDFLCSKSSVKDISHGIDEAGHQDTT